MEESQKAGNRPEFNPGYPGPVLCQCSATELRQPNNHKKAVFINEASTVSCSDDNWYSLEQSSQSYTHVLVNSAMFINTALQAHELLTQ